MLDVSTIWHQTPTKLFFLAEVFCGLAWQQQLLLGALKVGFYFELLPCLLRFQLVGHVYMSSSIFDRIKGRLFWVNIPNFLFGFAAFGTSRHSSSREIVIFKTMCMWGYFRLTCRIFQQRPSRAQLELWPECQCSRMMIEELLVWLLLMTPLKWL